MSTSRIFNKEIIEKIMTAQEVQILQPIRVGQTMWHNEMVFFTKPELIEVEDKYAFFNSLQLIEEKFKEFDVKVHGVAIVPGAFLEESEIMNRHYGFINQLSRQASQMVDPATRVKIFEWLGQEDLGEHQILGGHEFLNTFDTGVSELSDIWFAQEANKLRSGFYFIEDSFQGVPVILVNGFHPSQLQHFTRKDHRILLMLLHTDTDWGALKYDLVGDTFPERAKPDSIRGMLYADPDRYGQREVNINTNGVHLSAGPFEAAFEVVNFFGALLDLNPTKMPPLAIKRAIESGFAEQKAISLLENPKIDESDLFSLTENMNTDEAIAFAKMKLAEE